MQISRETSLQVFLDLIQINKQVNRERNGILKIDEELKEIPHFDLLDVHHMEVKRKIHIDKVLLNEIICELKKLNSLLQRFKKQQVNLEANLNSNEKQRKTISKKFCKITSSNL